MVEENENIEANSSSSVAQTSEERTSFERLQPSPTVIEALKRFAPNEMICAASLTRTILGLFTHIKEYAEGKLASLKLKDTPKEQTAQQWIKEVQTLFDPAMIKKLSKADHPPELHGRLLIIGLSLLEPELRKQLNRVDAFEALVKELWQPVPDILSERGRLLYESLSAGAAHGKISDSVPNQPDNPLQNVDEDQLGRAAFARYLAKRIEVASTDSGAYAIHLYGPWGSGKSSILNFLRSELINNGKWLVVEFNAWRHQHIRPPWWSLMESVYRQTKQQLNWRENFLESWWRFSTGRVHYMITFIVLLWLLVLFGFPLLRSHLDQSDWVSSTAAIADNISKIIAVILTIWGGIVSASRSLLIGSSRAAENYTERTHDSMNEIKKRFNRLVERLEPKQVTIFIDDLDRCQSSYVVELLEGIQTLFREAPVIFIVAADRRWLNACYEEVYDKLKPRVYEPGKPLGTLFLEKVFQLSTPMPGMPPSLKEVYWLHLLQLKTDDAKKKLEEARQAIQEEFKQEKSEETILGKIDASRDRPFLEQRALREEAVIRLAAPEIVDRTEHTLKDFVTLLEPNPRAMKRLVNAYSVNRALATLSFTDIPLKQLALWTILSMRWPGLVDFLIEEPVTIEKIGQENLDGIPEELKGLFNDKDVIQVVNGGTSDKLLNKATVIQCSQMCC